ncbi:MAG: helix-hairpin-helix domain-containing protein [Pyrinomonadaceae bacterium]
MSTKLLTLLLLCSIFAGCSTRIEHSTANQESSTGTININTATADELEKLPHIGRKTAESIVEFRTMNGPFRRAEHLMQIRGISEERFQELRPFIKTE